MPIQKQLPKMLSSETKAKLEKQQYRTVGSHSAVKVCGWTKNMIRGRGGCYKLKFYGIMSHRCLQMTTSISCANRCIICWRDYKSPFAQEWIWEIDSPIEILEGSLHSQKKLLEGFGGNEVAIPKWFAESKIPKHVALSLTGEPIMYPELPSFINLCHSKGISTFVVTNGQHPEAISKLPSVSQLYISLDAPTKELLGTIDNPLFENYWERLNQSLEILSKRKDRTAIRITLVKGLNDEGLSDYAKAISKGEPDIIEVKAYMHVGASQGRLSRDSMPLHEEVIAWSKELVKHLPDYELIAEHIPSKVALLVKKSLNKKTWIDFDKFFIEVKKPLEEQHKMNYSKDIPKKFFGLTGKTTVEAAKERQIRFKEVQEDKTLGESLYVCECGEESDL